MMQGHRDFVPLVQLACSVAVPNVNGDTLRETIEGQVDMPNDAAYRRGEGVSGDRARHARP